MNYNKVIYILIGAAVLLAFPLIYLVVMFPRVQTMPSPSQWLLFGALALPVAVVPLLLVIIHRVRRARGLSPEHISASDLRFMLLTIAVLCPLAVFAAMMFGAFGSLVIMLAPIACIIRSQLRSQPNPK